MTSTTIYTPITPTYLYIKQHSVTKKKYYGKTTSKDPYKYNGSGDYWSRHIKKHGKEHIVTLWVSELYYDTSIVEVALQFSADNHIVNSKEWANQKPENGLDGAAPGVKHTEETKAKLRKPHKPHKPRSDKGKPRKPLSEEAKVNMRKPRKPRSDKGKPKSEKHKANMKGRVAPNKGKSTPQETKDKISANMTGKKRGPQSEETKAKISAGNKGNPQPQITCPHCGKTGGNSNMKRWHFDNCKLASKA